MGQEKESQRRNIEIFFKKGKWKHHIPGFVECSLNSAENKTNFQHLFKKDERSKLKIKYSNLES